MQVGDWIVLPSKSQPSIHVGEIRSEYRFDAQAPQPFQHVRDVRWVQKSVPRSNFDQDLLYSFGAFMTICEVRRNDAETRVRKMEQTGWKAEQARLELPVQDTTEDSGAVDLEEVARDQIARVIERKFKGHDLTRLVDAVLRAQGYITFVSPAGPDKGVDILAAPAPLGFGHPRICVQVKSQDDPIDRPILDQLIGTMHNVSADQGLLVAWGGYKPTVKREEAAQFFKVRLWTRDSLIDELLGHYDHVDEAIRAELPLKRMWTVVPEEARRVVC